MNSNMQLSYSTYYDKVLGGWIGKCAGGILGAPIEGIKAFNTIALSEELFATNFPNDDLDLQVLWLDMVKKKGPAVRETDFAEHWVNHVFFPWNEYGIAARNIKLGVYPPESGRHNNYYWDACMGCPIRSEIWGMLCAGNPAKAMFYAKIDGSLDHDGFSVEAEQFLSACAAIAFFEDDIPTIFQQALVYFEPSSLIYQLVTSVIQWQKDCEYRTVMGKIKSYWGDADFTSAPMNIGFTILALLHSGDDFNCVMDALHLGHDSDCVAATAGALVGIIKGYQAIPDNWKKMVGNELLISEALKGIEVPSTIEELANQTCKAGISFISLTDRVALTGELPEPYNFPDVRFHITTDVSGEELSLLYENLSEQSQQVNLRLSSQLIGFHADSVSFHVNSGESYHASFILDIPFFEEPSVFYIIDVIVDDKQEATIKRGVLSYGSWLMAGPFIEDDKSRQPHHPDYPEHGDMSLMPSLDYMNHDKHNFDKDFLSTDEIKKLLAQQSWNECPFMVQKIYPKDFRFNLKDYYYGKGERTIYLSSFLTLQESQKLWISMGSTSPFKLWVNNELVYVQEHTSRSWIGDAIIPCEFSSGKNLIVLKLDMITDENMLEFGFKEFTSKHPHQEHWTLLVPKV